MHTMGCKVNQFESQAMEKLLRDRGHQLAADPADCDAFIVNTCAVTAEAGRKSRQAFRRIQAQAPEGAVGVVSGCWSQIDPKSAAELGADVVAGSADREKLLELTEAVYADRQRRTLLDAPLRRRTVEDLPAGNRESRTGTRDLLKIQDGCSNFCTYCIIPYARGPARSLPLDRVAARAADLASSGCREIVFTGIEIASYGKDFKDGTTLADAVETAAAAAPDARLRLGSLEPRVLTEEFVSRLAALGDRVCPHFHLSLQSGCDATLSRMHRRYTTEEFFAVTQRLRAAFPGCAIAADVIAGFPGETEEEFAETLAFLRRCRFAFLHVFPYSRRPGTPAASMPGQLSNQEKKARAERAIALGRELTEAYLDDCIGTVQTVLWEEPAGALWEGHGANYAVIRAKCSARRGELAKVIIKSREKAVLFGDLCKE